jgi:alpha-L-fucosidase
MNQATVKPGQLAFQDWEFGVFFHFGIRTFHEGHRDWDGKKMSLDNFCPEQLDCGQWIRTVKAAGARYAILVCKHHDGFANWPSTHSRFSVAQTPWLDGKGDVVRAFTDACRAFGIKVGLYYSPAERGHMERSPAEYDDYFIGQISELLTNYGNIDYLWFDGNGSKDHIYDAKRITGEIRRMQPEMLLFNMWDPDTRWIGNESGYAPLYNPCIMNASNPLARLDAPIDPERERFLPAECDCMMRERNWFYSSQDAHTVKSVETLMGIYEHSVGRGANMLINIGPDRSGLLPEPDASRLIEFGEEVRRRYGHPLEAMSVVSESEYAVEIELETPAFIDRVTLMETPEPSECVYPVERFSIEAWPVHMWNGKPIPIYYGGTIGHKQICVFPPIVTKKLRIAAENTTLRLKSAAVFAVPQPHSTG